jgi:hypothetical protein
MKVGGTSLASFLQSLYDRAEICPVPKSRVWDTAFAAEARRYELITGHFDTDFVRETRQPGIMLCMLRNPYDRIRSLYDFWRSFTWPAIEEGLPPVNGQRFAKLVTFEEFLLDAPLSKWKRQGQYDSLASCNQAKETFSQAMDSKVQLKNPNSVGNELSAYTAQCVTQDDPRFGKK